MIAPGKPTVLLNDILKKVSEGDILSHYLGISTIPCIINSPLRQDNHPSFGLYSKDGIKIRFKDFSTKESGGTFDLLGRLWNCNFEDCLIKINNDFNLNKKNIKINITKPIIKTNSSHSDIDLKCKIREWKDYDIKYWESYGISLRWLKFADVYPISHKIIYKNNKQYIFGADKYAYCFVEKKEGNVSIKIYQPFNKNGYKWSNKNDGSVIGLWTKVPKEGYKICICSSLKDSLCLWSNLGIPSIYLQGEGYSISNTAINELKRRYEKVYILFDNDEPGLKMAQKLSEETGFINVVLPNIDNKKDISDLYNHVGKDKFLEYMKPLFYPSYLYTDIDNDLPF